MDRYFDSFQTHLRFSRRPGLLLLSSSCVFNRWLALRDSAILCLRSNRMDTYECPICTALMEPVDYLIGCSSFAVECLQEFYHQQDFCRSGNYVVDFWRILQTVIQSTMYTLWAVWFPPRCALLSSDLTGAGRSLGRSLSLNTCTYTSNAVKLYFLSHKIGIIPL